MKNNHSNQIKVEELLAGYPEGHEENLIPILQDIQANNGFLSRKDFIEVGNHLGIASSKIYGVASFYNQFRFHPVGKYHIMICRGTACHVKGSKDILEELERQLKIKAGQTSRDNLFSIEIVACIGACGLAPVISVNGEFHGNLNKKDISGIIKKYKMWEDSNEE